MKRKSEDILSFLIDTISRWPGVDCICVDRRSEEDELDPHYALVFDIYYRRSVPAMDKRQNLFDNPGAFESAPGGMKDRFFSTKFLFVSSTSIFLEFRILSNIRSGISSFLRMRGPIRFIGY